MARRGRRRPGVRARRSDAGRGRRRLLRLAGLGLASPFLLTVLLVLPWRFVPPPTSAFMLREQIVEGRRVDYRWTPFRRISPWLGAAVIASEDQKFPEHHGFDLDAIADALAEPAARRRGASTISQQVAKNLFLWPGRSYLRKGLEAWLTVALELLWPKRRILEVYLNVAEFGPGVFGAGAASARHFAKPPARLSLREAALLAAVLPEPKRMSASRPSDYVRGRADEIGAAVRAIGGTAVLSRL